jgi:BirA family biotin operon repressor/biotin-[acetyl-CoA-carboxylase] ligase
MDPVGDLNEEEIRSLLPDRPVRSYPAALSTDADALAWGRAGAPEGALVVAEYQASPRGRAGLEWKPRPGRSLVFSLVLRPRLPLPREGWLYVVASLGVADALDGGTTLRWPDEVWRDAERAGAVATHLEVGPRATEWAVVTVFVVDAPPPRAPLLARVVEAIEARYRAPSASGLADYLRGCETLGRRVRARLIPLGPAGTVIEGSASTVQTDGSLVIETDEGRRLAVLPHGLGFLDEL